MKLKLGVIDLELSNRVKRIAAAVLVPVVVLAVSSCAMEFPVVMYGPNPDPHPRSPDQVKLFSGDDRPQCPFKEIGTIGPSSHTPNLPGEEVMAELRRVAGVNGADGVIKLRQGDVGTIGQGFWQGVLFVCTK